MNDPVAKGTRKIQPADAVTVSLHRYVTLDVELVSDQVSSMNGTCTISAPSHISEA